MIKLLKIEWLKVKAYPAFWWVIGITTLAYPGINYLMLGIYNRLLTDTKVSGQLVKNLVGNSFSFNEVWQTTAYFSSWFVLFPAIVVIMLITNEYTFKTQKQNIIDGWTRNQFLTAKLLDVMMISILVTLLYIGTTWLIGNSDSETTTGKNKTYFIGYFLLQSFSQLSVALFIGFIFRKSFIALSVFIFLYLILEPVLTTFPGLKKMSFTGFLPLEISDRMIPPPAFVARLDPKAYELSMNNAANHFIYTVVFTALLWFICFKWNARRDIR